MSVSLLAVDSQRAFQLGDAVSFGTLRGTTLTLDSLVVRNLTAEQIFVGEDALPDVYYYGQAPAANLLVATGSSPHVGDVVTATVRVNTDYLGQVVGSGNTANWNPLLNTSGSPNLAVIRLPSPLHYTLTSGGDALNPFVGAAIISAGTAIPNTSGAGPADYFARVRVGLQCYMPAITLRQKTTTGAINAPILPQADGLWLSLPMTAADALAIFSPVSGPATAQVSWYIIGTPPGTPPQPFGAVTAITPTLETGVVPYAPFPGTFTASKFVVNFAGGLLGSAVTFPVTGQATGTPAAEYGAFTTLGLFKVPGDPVFDVYPPVVFTSTGITNSRSLAAVSKNPNAPNGVLAPPALPPTPVGATPGYYRTNGIWIQQLWWISNGQGIGTGGLRAGAYNVSHFFTNAGNANNQAILGPAQRPLNPCRLEVTARGAPTAGQAPDDGPFSVNIYLPRVINTTTTLGTNVSLPTYSLNTNGALATPPIVSGTNFITTSAYGYWIVFLGTIGAGGADSTSMRASDGTAPPGGQAGASSAVGGTNAAALGQFSRYPGNWDVALDEDASFIRRPTNATGGLINWTSSPVDSITSTPVW